MEELSAIPPLPNGAAAARPMAVAATASRIASIHRRRSAFIEFQIVPGAPLPAMRFTPGIKMPVRRAGARPAAVPLEQAAGSGKKRPAGGHPLTPATPGPINR